MGILVSTFLRHLLNGGGVFENGRTMKACRMRIIVTWSPMAVSLGRLKRRQVYDGCMFNSVAI